MKPRVYNDQGSVSIKTLKDIKRPSEEEMDDF